MAYGQVKWHYETTGIVHNLDWLLLTVAVTFSAWISDSSPR